MDVEKEPLLINESTENITAPAYDYDVPEISQPYENKPPPYNYWDVPLPPQQEVLEQSVERVYLQKQQPLPTGHTQILPAPSDNFLTLSFVLSVVCCVCGTPLALSCTFPAIILAIYAREAEMRGDRERMRRNRTIALSLNITGFIFGLIVIIPIYIYIFFVLFYNSGYDYEEENVSPTTTLNHYYG